MATLILSTVGSALGGPIGGAIGSLIGQSIDQQIFAPKSRGPKLGDLSVQTSSYGTQIPRIYGTMRVAGTIVWATDLVQSTQTSGAKGQPDTTYSYSVSFAVALSSRRVNEVRRIWADGKLLRGESGDFKVNTQFRFYGGSEDQPLDPLIGSIEGSDSTPAYRGLALAVFENLELAEYGNRIPFLTFEVAADEDAPMLNAILADASDGRINCTFDTAVHGYAALGGSIARSVEPLIEAFGIELFDDGERLRSPDSGAALTVGADELGCGADGAEIARFEREQIPSSDLPATLTLSYYDPARDYQAGQARTDASEQVGAEASMDVPAVLAAADARTLAEDAIARRWAKRDKLELRLPPKFMTLRPGAVIALDLSPSQWVVERSTLEAMVSVAELRPVWNAVVPLAADGGRSVPATDVIFGPLSLALADMPIMAAQSLSGPVLYLAASTPSESWKICPLDLSAGGSITATRTAGSKATLGEALTILPGGQAELLDLSSSVDVELIDPDQWLTSCDDDALVQGTNLALIGNELIQFGSALPLGPGQFRLTRLLRGRGGTEWAAADHAIGDRFVLIDLTALQPIPLPMPTIGSVVVVSEQGGPATTSALVTGEALRPPSPAHLGGELRGTGELNVSWTRRSRLGWAWVDEIDAPLGERVEAYVVTVAGPAGTIERQCDTPAVTLAPVELATVGSGAATISVRQIGDLGASRPAELSLTLP
jgi:hypothetical protein